MAHSTDYFFAPGDLVTIEKGFPGTEGYGQNVLRVTSHNDDGPTTCDLRQLQIFLDSGWRVTGVQRSNPGLPDHAGAQAFTDRGMARSDGDTDTRWEFNDEVGHYYRTSDLPNPVEAIPVPAKELRSLAEALQGDIFAANAAAIELLDATRSEWQRAGIDGGLDG